MIIIRSYKIIYDMNQIKKNGPPQSTPKLITTMKKKIKRSKRNRKGDQIYKANDLKWGVVIQ